jgi:hypothetical protein
MEFIKGFFTKDNFTRLFERLYAWLENILDTVFGGMGYEPLRDLFVNPWFWIILLVLLILGIVFRRR